MPEGPSDLRSDPSGSSAFRPVEVERANRTDEEQASVLPPIHRSPAAQDLKAMGEKIQSLPPSSDQVDEVHEPTPDIWGPVGEGPAVVRAISMAWEWARGWFSK